MDIVARGAEAVVVREGAWLRKERVRKGYRHPALDALLREARTKAEARLLGKARAAGASVPDVEAVDATTIRVREIAGTPLKDALGEDPALARLVGDALARLHARDIIHADLTTSNVIVSRGEAVLIDFGLGFVSRRVEDKAVDVHLFRQSLRSGHPAIERAAFAAFREGYLARGGAPDVLERLRSVEARGRNKGGS